MLRWNIFIFFLRETGRIVGAILRWVWDGASRCGVHSLPVYCGRALRGKHGGRSNVEAVYPDGRCGRPHEGGPALYITIRKVNNKVSMLQINFETPTCTVCWIFRTKPGQNTGSYSPQKFDLTNRTIYVCGTRGKCSDGNLFLDLILLYWH